MTPCLMLRAEVRNDARLRMLTAEQFRVWFNLICYAAERDEPGVIRGVSGELLSIEVAGGDVAFLNATLDVLAWLQIITIESPVTTCNDPVTTCNDPVTTVTTLQVVTGSLQGRYIAFEPAGRAPSAEADRVRDRVAKCRERKRSGSGDEALIEVAHASASCAPAPTRKLCIYSEGELALSSSPGINNSREDGQGESSQVAIPQCRSQEDRALVEQARTLLCSDLTTDHLGIELGRQHNTPSMVQVAGWKWLRAAQIIQGPSCASSSKKRWPYFAGIAANLSEADRVERAAPVRESVAARRLREFDEGLQRRFAKEAKNG